MEFVADRILVVADRNLVVAEEILKYQMRNKSKKNRQDVHSKPSISGLNPGDIEIHLTLRVLNIFYWIFCKI